MITLIQMKYPVVLFNISLIQKMQILSDEIHKE